MTTAAPEGQPEPPTGVERIRSLVVSNAADLFAERGPAATPLRDIAARSGVNQGLIFRYVGNKDAIVAAVLEYLGDDLAAALAGGLTRRDVEAKVDRQWKVIARALLDGYDVGQLQRRFPNVDTLITLAQENRGDSLDARLAVADALALHFGWRLFGPFLHAAAGLPDQTEVEQRTALDERIMDMLKGAAGGERRSLG